jgi:hypothetical protein
MLEADNCSAPTTVSLAWVSILATLLLMLWITELCSLVDVAITPVTSSTDLILSTIFANMTDICCAFVTASLAWWFPLSILENAFCELVLSIGKIKRHFS